MIARLAVYASAGLVMSVLGLHTTDEMFWAMMALVWAAGHLGQHEGYDSAVAECQAVLDQAEATLARAQQLEQAR
jgi:hypothetical protein